MIEIKGENFLFGQIPLQTNGISDLLQFSKPASLGGKEKGLGHLLGDRATPLDDPSSEEVLKHRAKDTLVINPFVLKKFRVLCRNKSVDQLLGNPFIRDGNPIVHQEFSHHLILLRVNDRMNIEVSFLQRFKIRETMRVIEEEHGSAEKKQEGGEDKGVNHIKSQSLFLSLFGMILFFHEEKG
jgi:hypothetical protein